jgi:hypothetical protein
MCLIRGKRLLVVLGTPGSHLRKTFILHLDEYKYLSYVPYDTPYPPVPYCSKRTWYTAYNGVCNFHLFVVLLLAFADLLVFIIGIIPAVKTVGEAETIVDGFSLNKETGTGEVGPLTLSCYSAD